MEQRGVHLNCIKVQFEVTSKMPTDKEIFAFFRRRTWEPDTLLAMFRAPREHCIYVKFRTADNLKEALLKCQSTDTFEYDSGETTRISFKTAEGDFRYIRLFGLPIEISDKHVADALAKYGKVHHMIREKYGPDTGFPILNGVRGLQMEVAKPIPAQLYIAHFQARVSYEGMINKCYVCDSSGHLKVDCPKRKSATINSSSNDKSYATVLTGTGTGNDETPASSSTSQAAATTPILPPEKKKLSKSTPDQIAEEQNRNALGFEELAFGVSGEVDPHPRKPDEEEYGTDEEDPEWFQAKKRNRAEIIGAETVRIHLVQMIPKF